MKKTSKRNRKWQKSGLYGFIKIFTNRNIAITKKKIMTSIPHMIILHDFLDLGLEKSLNQLQNQRILKGGNI